MQKYLLDTNIYIGFYDRYYRPIHFPTFWDNIKTPLNENVVIPKVVLDESHQDEWIKEWVKENFNRDIINHKTYAEQFGEVLAHIQSSKYYRDDVLIDWAREKIADPWLLAIAKKENLIIVTDELPKIRDKNRPSKKAKIPDVAKDLSIDCINRNEFFARIDLIV